MRSTLFLLIVTCIIVCCFVLHKGRHEEGNFRRTAIFIFVLTTNQALLFKQFLSQKSVYLFFSIYVCSNSKTEPKYYNFAEISNFGHLNWLKIAAPVIYCLIFLLSLKLQTVMVTYFISISRTTSSSLLKVCYDCIFHSVIVHCIS